VSDARGYGRFASQGCPDPFVRHCTAEQSICQQSAFADFVTTVTFSQNDVLPTSALASQVIATTEIIFA
jgi:hypothetical protein